MFMSVLMQGAEATSSLGWWERLLTFVDSPAPYSPFSEYLLLLFIMWLIARLSSRKAKSFDTQAQEVLDEKFADGELSPEAYEKFRQEMILRPKR